MVATATQVHFENVPDKHANWEMIKDFAVTFEDCWFSEETGDIANSLLSAYRQQGRKAISQEKLDRLKAALFFEQRRYRILGTVPDGVTMQYISELTEEIRENLIRNHFRFRKPALRFSITQQNQKCVHLLSDGIFIFAYEYVDTFTGHGDCRIIRADKKLMNALKGFLLTEADSWENNYEDLEKNASICWELKVNIQGCNRKITGTNSFPGKWDDLVTHFEKVCGFRIF